MIERIETYRFDGCIFDELSAVKIYVENEIGKVIDEGCQFRLGPKERLAIFDALVKNRDRLVTLLTAKFYTDPDELQSDEKSIFDL